MDTDVIYLTLGFLIIVFPIFLFWLLRKIFKIKDDSFKEED